MKPDRIAILDWSAANRPRTGKDSIWLGHEDGRAQNLPTRQAAFEACAALIDDTLAQGKTLLIGADFPFAYPVGFARALTGRDDPLAIWDWLVRHLQDGPDNRSNRFALGDAINARLPGTGPFWFNATREPLAHLPRKGRARDGHGFAEHRLCDGQAKGAQSPWKLGGAGSVGSQALTGIPMLERLRVAFPDRIAVWPFEPLTKPVILAEVFPSLLAAEVAERMAPGRVKDQVQVTALARALSALPSLSPLLETPDEARIAEEGWILGLGHEPALREALRRVWPRPGG
ncbi:molybdopterin guanine dinucleotide synthesis [Rhodobacter sp. NTK016B]|uniref:molybdopterin guanine dinucleotide synthesis n=1 Tax=Rhodobacter sp. NTK016B TaxID=2759676 RepID=UPI001A8CFB84|nr:molybdopterin guanine dinucleotide synthesis [Rhodobacter sp. NTK016B]MBN8290701.1 molybdopterin guanine dinucleotide synthesis [Rhodobacter sp. NTK016B]